MKIIGTEQEINWLIEKLANGCHGCPYLKECNRKAEAEKQLPASCKEFLKEKMELEIQ